MSDSGPALDAVRKAQDQAVALLCQAQDEDGSFPGNYGGPLFLLPLYVASCRIIGHELKHDVSQKMQAYILSQQNEDGGWGLHVEGESTVYGSVANYVALRLLGREAKEPALRQARGFLHRMGGAVGSASWGKFFLALLDLYPYEHLNPLPPELWLLPESLPMHPSRLWCHCRMVYLPMSYLYGRRAKATYQGPEQEALLRDLRAEIYAEPYQDVDFKKARTEVAPCDNLTPQTTLSLGVHQLLRNWEAVVSRKTRADAMQKVLHQIDREDKNTNYICIGPINKLLNTLVWFFEDPEGPELELHRQRLGDYLYETPEGILMQGYNSSRLWDTAFAVQALFSAGAPEEARATLEAAHRYLDENQVIEDVCDRQSAYRHASKGGWPFSDRPHGWPISDCTAEGLKASILLEEMVPAPLSDARLKDAMELILSLQNEDGGWATYELTRGPKWLEKLNPSDCFREIMIDYSYVECTSACMQALRAYQERTGFPHQAIEEAMVRGQKFLLQNQRNDGSFEGSWGVCFTYGTWFGVNGLLASGLSAEHPALVRARGFLESVQRADGGFGESIKNCETRSYDPDTESQVVMTSWALLTLLACGAVQSPAVRSAVRFLLAHKREDGSFPPENIAGVFNKTCAIHYDNYLKIFPLAALSEYLRQAEILGKRGEQEGPLSRESLRGSLPPSRHTDIQELSRNRVAR